MPLDVRSAAASYPVVKELTVRCLDSSRSLTTSRMSDVLARLILSRRSLRIYQSEMYPVRKGRFRPDVSSQKVMYSLYRLCCLGTAIDISGLQWGKNFGSRRPRDQAAQKSTILQKGVHHVNISIRNRKTKDLRCMLIEVETK